MADDLFGLGFHALTSGDHIFDKREIVGRLDREPRILRPAIYPVETAGGRPLSFRDEGWNECWYC